MSFDLFQSLFDFYVLCFCHFFCLLFQIDFLKFSCFMFGGVPFSPCLCEVDFTLLLCLVWFWSVSNIYPSLLRLMSLLLYCFGFLVSASLCNQYTIAFPFCLSVGDHRSLDTIYLEHLFSAPSMICVLCASSMNNFLWSSIVNTWLRAFCWSCFAHSSILCSLTCLIMSFLYTSHDLQFVPRVSEEKVVGWWNISHWITLWCWCWWPGSGDQRGEGCVLQGMMLIRWEHAKQQSSQ